MEKTYNRLNFHKHTFCIFTAVDLKKLQGIKPGYTSKSGSSYYFTDEGVYRLSNHWGRAANCRWRLVGAENYRQDKAKAGYARWADFFADNDTDRLYFIAIDEVSTSVQSYHKGCSNYVPGTLLRTAAQTTRRLREIKKVLEDASWAKYLKGDDPEAIREEILQKLISTDLPFQQIRKGYL